MILSDRYRFIFIHVPKCAGTSVRAAVLPYHDADSRFLKTVGHHQELGEIDYRHLPLNLLRSIDFEAFEKLNVYQSFALLRDPFQRFRSALAQRAKMYLGKEFAQLSEDEIRIEIDKIITYLHSEPRFIAPDFIHFSRQSEFVQIDEERLVHNLFPVERLDLFATALGQHIGTNNLQVGHANKTTVFRYPRLKNMLRYGSSIAQQVLPGVAYERIRISARNALMKPSDNMQLAVFNEASVQNFIRDYYATDIALHQEIMADMAS